MHIQAVSEVNTQQQQKPFSMRSIGYEAAIKRASIMSFTDCLKSYIQDVRPPASIRGAEEQAAGSIWGYFLPQWVPFRPESKSRARADESRSDL